DDSVPTCNLDCTTNSDGGIHVDCFETFCGTNPNDNESECHEVRSEAELSTAIDAANGNGGPCGGSECSGCACLPLGSFWQYSADPLYSSVTVGDPNLYCLGASSVLIDGGADLSTYDLNGAAPGDFNQSSPDIGGREDGPSFCD
ncbi:MAG: hypothetical protein KJN97_12860, partial [Deltaproteobacteria bacterium]|nr:hypothetical protein [Deltaproteobacteria bacterium]